MTADDPLKVCLFGVSSLANLGLGALRTATVGALVSRDPDVQLTIFDDGFGVRPSETCTGDRVVATTLCGARNSRRIYRPEAYLNMRASAGLGGLRNAGLARIDASHAVLDLSGGDSFSDIYGRRRFRTVAWPKRLAVLRNRPLVLLPQTYGPFRSSRVRAEAADLVRRSAMAWARDPDSFGALRDLLGADFDPARHREGVDVAFALDPREPDEPAREQLLSWWRAAPGPVAGINVSGLLRGAGNTRFGLRADPWGVVVRLCERLLAEPDVRIMLVPHVRTAGGVDDDVLATNRLHAALAATHHDRVAVAPAGLAPDQAKWVISRATWFVGMRMHATIAALSTGVATAGVAYSMKMRGVFATVGQEKHVADARHLSDDELCDVLWRSWQQREAAAADLAVHAPATGRRARRQLDDVVTSARAERGRRG